MTCGGGCCRPAPPLQATSNSASGLPPSSGRADSNQPVLPPEAGPQSMSPVPPTGMPPAGRLSSFMAESDIQVESKGPPSDHASLPDPTDAAGRHRVTLSVIGMDCPSCAPRVVRALTNLPSVADCQVDIFAARAVVTYHPSQVQVDEMPKRVTAETGFRCQVIQDSPVEQAQDDSKRMKIHVERPQAKYPEMDGVRVVSYQAKVLEVEYDARLNPRDVLAFFEPYSPTYVAPPQALGADSAQRQVLHLLRLTLISTILCIPVLVVAWAPLPPNPTAYGGISLALTTLIQLLVARPIYTSGLRALIIQRTIDMDLLVSISTGTAYVFSTVAYACSVAGKPIGNDDETYFETAALLVTLVMFGRLIAAYARRRSTNAVVELSSMQSLQATLVDPATGMTSVIPMGLVHVGDVLRIASGECVPTDGRVIQGEAYADESSITGESVPVFKRPGAVLVAGTKLTPHTPLGPAQNQTSQADNNEASKECCQKGSCCGPTNSLQDGSLDMRVTLSPDSNTLSRMVELLRTAQGARLRVQDTADRVSGYLAPVVLVIATVVLCAWIGVGVSNARKLADSVARSAARREAVVAAIGYTVAVLVVSCPCAIALCVPMVAVIAVAVGTKQGVLFKTVEALESTTSVEVVVFDKTGTLTLGKLAVESSAYYPHESSPVWWLGSEEGIQGVVRALTDSMHPVSVAVHEHVITLLASTSDSDRTLNVRNFPGQGVEATVDGVTVRGGSAAWANVQGMGGESTVFVVSISTDPANSKWTCIARYTLSDSLRPDALATIRTLSARGLEVHILSGDTQAVVARTAASLGIPTSQARGGCSPEDKAQWVKFIQMGGQECETGCCGSEAKERVRARKVMFIGDGTNDALALVQSNVGVSLGGGTDVASSAAQIVLISSLGTGLSNVFTLSRAAQRRIWINFIWAGVYNTSAILFASGVLGEVRIPPQFAGLGELVSVLPVIAVGWSLGVGSW